MNVCPSCGAEHPFEDACPACGLILWDCCKDCGGELDIEGSIICSHCRDNYEQNHPDEMAEQDAMIESGYADSMDDWEYEDDY